VFLAIGSENKNTSSSSSSSSSSNYDCGLSKDIDVDMAIGFKPHLLPFKIMIDKNGGVKIEGEMSLPIGFGDIVFTASVGEAKKAEHKVRVTIRDRNTGLDDEYYFINTDAVHIVLVHDEGKTDIKYKNDGIVIDVTDSNMVELQFKVNDKAKQADKIMRNAQVITNGAELHLRGYPDFDANTLTMIPNRKYVTIIRYDDKYVINPKTSKRGKWVEICYNNQRGWVWGWYLITL